MRQNLQRHHAFLISASILLVATALPVPQASARFVQQGPKLVGTETLDAQQGWSAALSGDGNTALVGAPGYAGGRGATWVFTRSNGLWQEAQELVGTGAIFNTAQGGSVALSADGNTAIVGGYGDNGSVGAVWIFVRSNGVWTQQGGKLVGSGAVGNAEQGWSVALAADGNTAIVGGNLDNSFAGAAWVFTRSGAVWTQQGSKLVGTGAVGNAFRGTSVALSADGNTAIVGGPGDNSSAGAVWVFTRSSGGVWTQQGGKLVGTGGGSSSQGSSVALSADGNTAIIGGPPDNANAGAAWVFTRSGAVWTQQGSKLVGTGGVDLMGQGTSVALSGDGNTALVGGPMDDNFIGAAWAFTRSGGVWTQLGSKLVGSGATGSGVTISAHQGYSVALSGDGKTALLGGYLDNYSTGAAWPFVQSAAGTHDFNGDGFSDIAWRDGSGAAALWLLTGAQVLQSGGLGSIPISWQIVGQRDFNGDGKHDLLWRDGGSGTVAIWLLNGVLVASSGSLGTVPSSWTIVGTGDFDGDGKGDILWRDSSGNTAIWLINGLAVSQTGSLGNIPTTWSVIGVADFDGDGKADILWRDSSGNVAIWLMNGLLVQSAVTLGQLPTSWSVVGTGDVNGDGNWDILWRDSSGYLAIWFMNGVEIASTGLIGMVPSYWSIAVTGDFNRDGKSDILWRNTTTGAVGIWFMNGVQIVQSAGLGQVALGWTIQGLNVD
jgi:hypothetical protein